VVAMLHSHVAAVRPVVVVMPLVLLAVPFVHSPTVPAGCPKVSRACRPGRDLKRRAGDR
jgi:hypothetical protein